ncbi:hypothetical protein D3C87_157590 [compost metagenome]
MRKTFLKSALMVSVLVAGLSLASCKDNKETTIETDTTVEADGDTITTTETEVDMPGGKNDTISVTTDTIKVTKP